MSAGMRTPAAQPPLSKFWSRGSEARTSFSLEDETSCRKTATSPEQCDHAESFALADGTLHGREEAEIAIFGNYLSTGGRGVSGPTPVVTAVENYALFIWGCPAESQ